MPMKSFLNSSSMICISDGGSGAISQAQTEPTADKISSRALVIVNENIAVYRLCDSGKNAGDVGQVHFKPLFAVLGKCIRAAAQTQSAGSIVNNFVFQFKYPLLFCACCLLLCVVANVLSFFFHVFEGFLSLVLEFHALCKPCYASLSCLVAF